MAHLLNNTAIFSPSVARAAASAAKDWSYIDSWLARKFPSNRPPPPFERNADTLKALLALAAANEAADEERALLFRLESETLSQLQKQQPPKDDLLTTTRESILTSLEDSLAREGSTALTSLAQLSLQLNSSPFPNPVSLASDLLSLQSQLAELEQTLARIDILTSYISSESESLSKLSSEIDARPRPSSSHSDDDNGNHDNSSASNSTKTKGYHPHPSLAKSNLAAQRRIRTLSTRIQELSAHASPNLSTENDNKGVSIQDIHAQEQAYLELLQQKKELDAQLAGFAGLPHDIDAAREELENLRIELRRTTERRDSVFEGLVERETPKKGRSGTIGRR
ncbi:hypothetical protein B0T21DRAFT_375685 [Apiosordaria backusii]|uniref:Uncharacterized protein n=1 Tax=Apiosordaria backusii TaxID=314023 RepID=A0AA40DUW7_9PEZI|nr:hypothetical protein B0T21DRAFT_375685 [Apiosordaria backusii]